MEALIALLPGDGIGPEVLKEAVRILQAMASLTGNKFRFNDYQIGGCSIDSCGTALTEDTIKACQKSDAVLLGAVGGPKWDNPASTVRPEQGLLLLRKELGVYANLRPIRVHPALVNSSALKPERLVGVDMIVVRELTGGLYFGKPRLREKTPQGERAVDTLEYYDYEVQRVVELAFKLAAGRRRIVTSVDKANVLESSRLWRQTTQRVGEKYPDVALSHMLVDTASMRLISNPDTFDVLVTENMFGDILTDEASVLAGSMGLLPSASLGDHTPGLFEPIHGSAPDIAGKGIANPLGMILSVAMMLRYSLNLIEEAVIIENAVDKAITDHQFTTDLGGTLSTQQMADVVYNNLTLSK